MKLGWNQLQTAVYEALIASEALNALVEDRVYTTLRDPPFVFPFVILSDWESGPSLDKPGLHESTLSIEVKSLQRGNVELNNVLEAIVGALINVRLTPGGGIGKTAGRYAGAGGDVEQWDTGQIVQSGILRVSWLIYEANT